MNIRTVIVPPCIHCQGYHFTTKCRQCEIPQGCTKKLNYYSICSSCVAGNESGIIPLCSICKVERVMSETTNESRKICEACRIRGVLGGANKPKYFPPHKLHNMLIYARLCENNN